MGDSFKIKSRYHLYVNQKTKERMKEIENHLQEKYDGISDFVEKKMQEEQALDIDERIRRKKQEKREAKEDLKQLKQVKKDRNQRKELDEKEPVLKEKQEKESITVHGQLFYKTN